MNTHLINTEKDYRNALQEIEGLMMAKTDTPEGERLHALLTLVEEYEQEHYSSDE